MILTGPSVASTTTLKTVTGNDVAVTDTGAFTIAGGDEGGTVTRATGTGTWASLGFTVGQLVRVEGQDGGWRLMEITNSGRTLRLARGGVLLPSTTMKTVFVAGPHGGLTVVHGGGNMPLQTVRHDPRHRRHERDAQRLDGLAWTADGYATAFANGHRCTSDHQERLRPDSAWLRKRGLPVQRSVPTW